MVQPLSRSHPLSLSLFVWFGRCLSRLEFLCSLSPCVKDFENQKHQRWIEAHIIYKSAS